jgi:Protein of unknown function (DUF3071)
MPKLFLVGITPDHRGLVLSDHARAKRGDMVLEIDDRLLEAIDKANRLRTRDEGVRLESNALPSRRHGSDEDNGAVTRLSPREIQQRLRAGESVAALAKSSGTDEAWIRRFAAPVLAEQAKVVERARSVTYHKRGVGLSAASLAQAVAANVIDKGVPLTLPDLEAGWSAYQHPEGGWRVTFTFPLRGRRQTAEWEIDPAAGDLTARNKLATELGWRESAKKLPQPKPAKAPAVKRPPAAKAQPPAKTEDPAPAAQAVPPSETPQTLPLSDETDKTQVVGLVRRVSRPPKRAAAAKVESPAETVVPVPEGSMPPTDLDVVDVVVDLRPLEDEAVREPAPLGAPPAPQGGPPAP